MFPSSRRIAGNHLEKRWNSSAICSQDFRHCRFFTKPKMICENGTSSLKISQTESSLCQCSTTSIGQEKKMMEFVFRVQKVKEYPKRFAQGHWTFLRPGDEKKWRGTHLCTLERKWDSKVALKVERFKETGHPVFEAVSALSWDPDKENSRKHHSLFSRCFDPCDILPFWEPPVRL